MFDAHSRGRSIVKLKKRIDVITIPTDDRRHISKIRFGKVSHEVFCKNPERRRELGLPVVVAESD